VSSDKVGSPETMLMLSRLQWEVSQAQWSDLHDVYTFSFGYRGYSGGVTMMTTLHVAKEL